MEYNGAKMAARNTFLIDPEGKIARVYPKLSQPSTARRS